MKTIINITDLLIVSPYFPKAELTEVPAPGRSPEAPGGPEDETLPEVTEDEDEPEDEMDPSRETPEADGYQFPDREDPMM